jgi:TPR repeat protein
LALPFAKQGITVAQCLVGVCYQIGAGGEVNGRAAETWLRKAGEGGCALAWHNLSTLYLVGAPGFKMNREEAMECRRKAVENGFDLIVPEDQDSQGRSLGQ